MFLLASLLAISLWGCGYAGSSVINTTSAILGLTFHESSCPCGFVKRRAGSVRHTNSAIPGLTFRESFEQSGHPWPDFSQKLASMLAARGAWLAEKAPLDLTSEARSRDAAVQHDLIGDPILRSLSKTCRLLNRLQRWNASGVANRRISKIPRSVKAFGFNNLAKVAERTPEIQSELRLSH
ncbi:MAG TPA: hypothetical protein VKV22_01235 [Rhodanobacteraceae bacterium]|nr:hypothetical protein [Rhodanobacteraceae bacterium]